MGVIYYKQKLDNQHDAEMIYVSKILNNKRRFLDIGANFGVYSYHFKDTFKNIDAFEPIGEVPRIDCFQNDFFKVHNVALSNNYGTIKLNIPIENGKISPGLASLEKRHGECEVRTVNVNTVDSYNFDDVDLIKIDVEGHEKQVIEGALKTIKKTMPIMIVEIEQRHIQQEIDEVFQRILNHNYNGYFFLDGSLTPLKEFSYELHQKPYLENVYAKKYVNNFIFIPNN